VIRQSGGQDWIPRIGTLDFPGVEQWLFCPGMLFQSTEKWWGDRGSRPRPHEGVDLLLYLDRGDRVRRLDETAQIRAFLDGTVVGMIPDFLGESVIVEHPPPDENGDRVHLIYAHTRPSKEIAAGTRVSRGDAIATLALPGRSSFPMAPHLHVSVAQSAQPVGLDHFNWHTLGDSKVLTLLDPLGLAGIPHRIVGGDDPACRDL